MDFNVKEKTKCLDSKDTENIFAAFGEQNVNKAGENFEKANLNAIFGSVKLDLREAKLEKETVIGAWAIFGGIEILVPKDCIVKVKGTPIFGGISNERKNKEDAKKILNSSEFKEFMGNIVGNYVNYILTDNKTDIVSKSDIRKIINKIEDITGNKIEVDEDEIVNAINEIKENSEVSKEVVMTISYFKGNTIYIWLTIIIIISYLLVSLFTNSFYKPLNYLSIPIMLSGITFVILFNIMNISPNISNSMIEIISYILNPLLYIGIILIIASVLMIIIYNLIKNKKGNFTV